jgi:hypothetical protein
MAILDDLITNTLNTKDSTLLHWVLVGTATVSVVSVFSTKILSLLHESQSEKVITIGDKKIKASDINKGDIDKIIKDLSELKDK